MKIQYEDNLKSMFLEKYFLSQNFIRLWTCPQVMIKIFISRTARGDQDIWPLLLLDELASVHYYRPYQFQNINNAIQSIGSQLFLSYVLQRLVIISIIFIKALFLYLGKAMCFLSSSLETHSFLNASRFHNESVFSAFVQGQFGIFHIIIHVTRHMFLRKITTAFVNRNVNRYLQGFGQSGK